VLFDLGPGMIGVVHASPLGELFRPGNLVNHTRGKKWAKHPTKGLSNIYSFTQT
jgi:hypothetical protein